MEVYKGADLAAFAKKAKADAETTVDRTNEKGRNTANLRRNRVDLDKTRSDERRRRV